jgi:hypothetical protein
MTPFTALRKEAPDKQTVKRVVASGITNQLAFFVSLNPDCSSRGIAPAAVELGKEALPTLSR